MKITRSAMKSQNNDLWDVDTDRSRSCGILHFSHEISMTVRYFPDKVEIVSGWEIAAEDVDWEPGDEDWFTHMHPGLLEEIHEEITKKIRLEGNA